jgi:hypothetical protein
VVSHSWLRRSLGGVVIAPAPLRLAIDLLPAETSYAEAAS